MIASIFLAWPCFNCFDPGSIAWEVVFRKAADPLDDLRDVPEYLWLSKKVFRLTVPLIISIMGLGPIGTIVLQFAVNYLLFAFTFKLALRVLKDPIAATWLTAGLAFLYFGRAGLHDLEHLWFDGLAFFFLIAAMHARRPIAIFLWCTLAAWTDERAFMALGNVLLFHQLEGVPDRSIRLLRPKPNGVAALIAIGAYLVLRIILAGRYDLPTSTYGAEPAYLERTLIYLPIGAWTFLEGFWIILIAVVGLAFRSRHYFLAFFLAIASLCAIMIAGSVSDITRSGSYLVPIVFVCLLMLKEHLAEIPIRRLLLVAGVTSLLFPAVIVCPDWEIARWSRPPLPVQVLRVWMEGGMR